MDALEFLKARKRMCENHMACNGCPLERSNCGLDTSMSDKEYGRIITAVEKWSKEHSHKTRQNEFLKQFPNAELDYQGSIAIDPCDIDTTFYKKNNGCYNGQCEDCRREFWMQEVE